MVHLTKEAIEQIEGIWKGVPHVDITAHALERVFEVFPWTTRLFKSFHGHFKANDNGVQEHAKKVAHALDLAIKDINGINHNFEKLSIKHQQLGVDTHNFKLLGQAFLVQLAIAYKTEFTPQKHKLALEFFKMVAAGLSNEYH
ncbi:hemoglobin subunit beta-like [Narcine bancroftii]|uniref:hemoglobin subunit beta-like n=1 Tax=Narcine bancroftii TaxID=1343680 RepID=UPI0038315ACB